MKKIQVWKAFLTALLFASRKNLCYNMILEKQSDLQGALTQ